MHEVDATELRRQSAEADREDPLWIATNAKQNTRLTPGHKDG